MRKKQAKGAELTFDAALTQLEQLVDEMERGDLPLEAALEKYAEGAALAKTCMVQLQAAERAVHQVIAQTDGKLSEMELELPEAD